MKPARNKILIICKDLLYPAGAPLYSLEVMRILHDFETDLYLLTSEYSSDIRDELLLLNVTVIERESFFKHSTGMSGRISRVREDRNFIKLIKSINPDVCFVLGDRPRLVYNIGQKYSSIVFYLHEISMTCPGDPGFRFLKKSRTMCEQRVGMSCLFIDKSEECMGNRSIPRKIQRIYRTYLSLKILQRIKNLIANSSYTAEMVSFGTQYCKPEVIHPVIPLNSFRWEYKPRLPENRHRIAFIGRLEEEKGVFEALHILSLLPDFYSMIFIGNGSAKGGVKKLSEDLGIVHRVTLTGWLDRKSVIKELAHCGIVLVPSLCAEGFGMAGPEALLMGTPVIAYKVGGINDWCRGDFARLVTVGDRKGAAQAILAMTEDFAFWQELSKGAREYATHFFDQSINATRLRSLLGLQKT